jgi:hypothetical protein
MTDHILSSLEPLGTESGRELEKVLMSLTSRLMVADVTILCEVGEKG